MTFFFYDFEFKDFYVNIGLAKTFSGLAIQ